jgi:hypothetical protein
MLTFFYLPGLFGLFILFLFLNFGHFLLIILNLLKLLFLFDLLVKLLLPLLDKVRLLLSLVLINIGNSIDIDLIVRCEANAFLPQDLLHPGDLEQEERVGHLSDLKQLEVKDESKLMLLVIPNKADKSILGFID